MISIDRAQVESFRTLVTRQLGLQFDEGKLDFLSDVLRRRVDALGLARCDLYLEQLGSSRAHEEFRALADLLTVGETFFFRNPDHFRAFTEIALPERMRARGHDKRLRVLSAGCASGEEPYSIATLMRERVPAHEGWNISITGIDLNPASLAKAAAARYTPWALRATADQVRDRYFRPQGRDFVLAPEIKSMVAFEERNLTTEPISYWRSLDLDAVFCRNVLMYFTPEKMSEVVQRLVDALAPGGYLFLGHAETLRGLTQDFHLCHTHDTFYYRKRGADEPKSLSTDRFGIDFARPPDILPAIVDSTTSWYEVIQRASERVTSLANGQSAPTPAPAPRRASDPPMTRTWDLGLVRELMKQERFVDALAALGAMPPDSMKDPDSLLLRAILLANSGRLPDAEEICRQLLALDDLNAGAHYLMALCREHAADAQGATEHDQTAAYLDSGFAMPHLHLGLLARRLGDATTARRELGLAEVLLVREDAPRILLFGGGFSREALMNLCRLELNALGVAA